MKLTDEQVAALESACGLLAGLGKWPHAKTIQRMLREQLTAPDHSGDVGDKAAKPSPDKSADEECEHQFEPFKPGLCICEKCHQVQPVEHDEHRAALVSNKAAAVTTAQELPNWFEMFLTNVCELPDRNSPEDEPAAIVATLEELKACALNAIDQPDAATKPAQTGSKQRVYRLSTGNEPGSISGYDIGLGRP